MNAEISLKRRVLVFCLRICCEAPVKRFIIMRQLSSRNQRYKGGNRLRHFVQICFLLAICIWLVYQLKHSDDNRRAFVERKVVEEQPFPFSSGMKALPNVKESELISKSHRIVEDDIENGDDEAQQEEMMKDDVKNEEGKGDADEWIDEQDQDQQGQENEQEVEFQNEDKNKSYVGNADSVDTLVREDNVLDAIGESNKTDNVSRSVAHETHMNEAEPGLADARVLDVEKSDDIDANLKGSSFNVAVDVSNKIRSSPHNGNLNDFMSNHSGVSLRENATFPDAANHSMNWTSSTKSELVFEVLKHENGSIFRPIPAEENNPNELQRKSTTATLPVVTDVSKASVSERLIETANHSTVADSLYHKRIQGNETASLIHVSQKHTIQNATSEENHSKLVELVVDLEHDLKSKTSEEQESEDQFATTTFSKNEINLSHIAVTVEEREARTDLSTLPEILNDIRHDYDEAEE